MKKPSNLLLNFKTIRLSEKMLLLALLVVTLLAGYALLYKYSMRHSSVLSTSGGALTEGVIGTARFINPVLALSDTDKDLTALVYSGLMRPGPDGNLQVDLAEKYSVSKDGKVYTFTLRPNATFQDGSPVTAADVAFTIQRIQDPASGSPLRPVWKDITAQIIDDRTISFTLKRPFYGFLENTTVGILPKHIWEQSKSSEMQLSIYNEKPVGSGPFKLESIQKDKMGIPSSYHLVANENFYLSKVKIQDLYIKTYPNSKERLLAWKQNELNALSAISPMDLDKYTRKDTRLFEMKYPREFMVFFNPAQNTNLSNTKVRKALSLAINKKKLAESILQGHADALYGPASIFIKQDLSEQDKLSDDERSEQINKLMSSAGWKKNKSGLWEKKDKEFTLVLSVSNADELEKVANFLQDEWKKAGFKVVFKKYELGSLIQKIIRQRKFEALLFGEMPGRAEDLYAFWHSSERDDPGLNIAQYHNKKVDALLSRLSTTQDDSKRQELLKEINAQIVSDAPAVFLYSPHFLYILPRQISGNEMHFVNQAHERFADIYNWSLKRELLWNWFK